MDLMHTMPAPESAGVAANGDAYGEIYRQLQATVRQLVQAAVAQSALHEHRRVVLRNATPTRFGAVLTEREYEVLEHVAAGDTNKMIARSLKLSPHTVKRHVANILDKLDARSRGQAAAWLLSRS